MIILKMPKTESDRTEGINDGNIETYKNNPMLSLTKEELQNSTDQAQIIEGIPKKVRVEFNDFYLKSTDLPDYEHVLRVFEEEKKFWDNYLENDKKAVDFFDNGIKLLQKKEIRCLRISDFNTTGLTGIGKKTSSPFKNLVKSKGVSDKPGYSGGSFGIGKDAAFACSQLRTVFYNTYNIDGEKAFEGAIKLPSYQTDDANYDGFGFFCNGTPDTKTDPVLDSISIDPSFNRKQVGMDKYILGFFDELSVEELKDGVIVSSIENFLTALYFDKVEIQYGDTIINKENLDETFEKYSEQISPITKEVFSTLKEPDKTITMSMIEENDIIIYIKLDPNYQRKAAVVRQNGMKVFEQGHISGRIGFCAVVYLAKNKVNAYFKKLENSEHNQWSEERAGDTLEAKKEAKDRKTKIFNRLKEEVKAMVSQEDQESMDSDGLNEYLPFTYITGKQKTIEGLNEKAESVKELRRKRKSNKETETIEQIELVEDEYGDTYLKEELGQDEPTPPRPTPPGPVEPFEYIITEDVSGLRVSDNNEDREFLSNKKIPQESISCKLIQSEDNYKLKIVPNLNIRKGYLELHIAGEDVQVDAPVQYASINNKECKVKNNMISFDNMNKNEIYNVLFKLKRRGRWALEVSVHESKE